MRTNKKTGFRKTSFTVGVALLATALASCGGEDAISRPTGPQVERPSFQADRAFTLVSTQLAFGPRVPGTQGHDDQLDWMVETLAARGATVVLDRFDYTTTQGVVLPLTNVLARYNVEAERRLLLVTHWDTRPTSEQSPDPADHDTPVPGANDGASGTAILLELASLFQEQAPTIGVDLFFNDGEDYGPTTDDMFIGAKRFAETQENQWAYAILIDMVGDADPSFPIEGHSWNYAPEVAQRVWSVANDLGYRAYFPETIGPPVTDDHLHLNAGGIRTIDIIDFVYGPNTKPGGQYWHTPDDTIEQVSAFTLGMVGEVLAEVVYRGG